MHRIDRKYVVTAAQYAAWLTALQPELCVLEIDGRTSFHYASTYFDTPSHTSFLSSAQKRRFRFKVRVRTYLDSGLRYVEVKVRDSREGTEKLRQPCSASSTQGLDTEAQTFVARVLLKAGIPSHVARDLVPALETHFTRTTLLVRTSGCRVTVDTELTFAAENSQEIGFPELLILETKSDSHDTHADKVLWRMGVRPQRLSKFAIGSALLNAELPSNKWSRIMRRHFQPSAAPAPVEG